MEKSTFTDKVNEVVRNIPAGSVLSYKEVSEASRSPKAHRAVANIMAKNFDLTIPCHRVIRSDGALGGYNRGGEKKKRELLINEGAIMP